MTRAVTYSIHPEGTWMPKDPDEFNRCALHTADYEGGRFAIHKTADGGHWIGRGHAWAWSVPYGKPFRTRNEAFWDAVKRLRKEVAGQRAA